MHAYSFIGCRNAFETSPSVAINLAAQKHNNANGTSRKGEGEGGGITRKLARPLLSDSLQAQSILYLTTGFDIDGHGSETPGLFVCSYLRRMLPPADKLQMSRSQRCITIGSKTQGVHRKTDCARGIVIYSFIQSRKLVDFGAVRLKMARWVVPPRTFQEISVCTHGHGVVFNTDREPTYVCMYHTLLRTQVIFCCSLSNFLSSTYNYLSQEHYQQQSCRLLK